MHVVRALYLRIAQVILRLCRSCGIFEIFLFIVFIII